MRTYRGFFLLALVAGCNGGTATDAAVPGSDAASTNDAASTIDTGVPGSDTGTPNDAAVPGNDAASTVCSASGGSGTYTTGCDLLQIAVLDHDGAPSQLLLTGRIYQFMAGSSMPTCAVIDGVDIVQDSATSTVIQHLDGGASIAIESEDALLAQGVPAAGVASVCASDDPAMRFESFGIVVHGHVDGGTFVAQCARAESGERWPPALRVTCHHNVDAPPESLGNANIMSTSFMGMTLTASVLQVNSPHGDGGALTTVDSTIHIIPHRSIFDTGMPLTPFDTTGWMGSASEGSSMPPDFSVLAATAATAQFDMTMCPVPPTGTPGPGYVPPPAFLARFTGMGGHGAYSTEAFLGGCSTTSAP